MVIMAGNFPSIQKIHLRLRMRTKEYLHEPVFSFITMVFVLVGTVIAFPLFASQLIPAGANNSNPNIAHQTYVTFAQDHVKFLDGDENAVQLILDPVSGSGFASKNKYLYGSFSMQIKLIPGDSAGTVTAYYLSSEINDEFDFEFLGNVSGRPYVLQTNIYANGTSGREHRIYLWFDPTANFHTYTLLWTKYHTVFFVDSTPIRIFKNNEATLGVPYISRPMRMYSSLWNGDYWATRWGKDKINWSHAPFVATFRNFTVAACVWNGGRSNSSSSHAAAAASASACARARSSKKAWSQQAAYDEVLSPQQLSRYNLIRNNYTVYDYCKDLNRYPSLPAECNSSRPPDISSFSTVLSV